MVFLSMNTHCSLHSFLCSPFLFLSYFRASQRGWGWKGPLQITVHRPPAQGRGSQSSAQTKGASQRKLSKKCLSRKETKQEKTQPAVPGYPWERHRGWIWLWVQDWNVSLPSHQHWTAQKCLWLTENPAAIWGVIKHQLSVPLLDSKKKKKSKKKKSK